MRLKVNAANTTLLLEHSQARQQVIYMKFNCVLCVCVCVSCHTNKEDQNQTWNDGGGGNLEDYSK